MQDQFGCWMAVVVATRSLYLYQGQCLTVQEDFRIGHNDGPKRTAGQSVNSCRSLEGQDSGLADVDSSHETELAAVAEKQETDGYNGWEARS